MRFEERLSRQLAAIESAGAASVSQSESAELLGWGLPRLRAAVHHGRIEAVHLSGRGSVRIPRAEIERIQKEQNR